MSPKPDTITLRQHWALAWCKTGQGSEPHGITVRSLVGRGLICADDGARPWTLTSSGEEELARAVARGLVRLRWRAR